MMGKIVEKLEASPCPLLDTNNNASFSSNYALSTSIGFPVSQRRTISKLSPLCSVVKPKILDETNTTWDENSENDSISIANQKMISEMSQEDLNAAIAEIKGLLQPHNLEKLKSNHLPIQRKDNKLLKSTIDENFDQRFDLSGKIIVLGSRKQLIFKRLETSICKMISDEFNQLCIYMSIDDQRLFAENVTQLIYEYSVSFSLLIEFDDSLDGFIEDGGLVGYTFTDLLKLFRSQLLAQRIVALQSIIGLLNIRDQVASWDAYLPENTLNETGKDQDNSSYVSLISNIFQSFKKFSSKEFKESENHFNLLISAMIRRMVVKIVLQECTAKDFPTVLPTLLYWGLTSHEVPHRLTSIHCRMLTLRCVQAYLCSSVEEEVAQSDEIWQGVLGWKGCPGLLMPHTRRSNKASYESQNAGCVLNYLSLQNENNSMNDEEDEESQNFQSQMSSTDKFALYCRWNRIKSFVDARFLNEFVVSASNGIETLLSLLGSKSYQPNMPVSSSQEAIVSTSIVAMDTLSSILRNSSSCFDSTPDTAKLPNYQFNSPISIQLRKSFLIVSGEKVGKIVSICQSALVTMFVQASITYYQSQHDTSPLSSLIVSMLNSYWRFLTELFRVDVASCRETLSMTNSGTSVFQLLIVAIISQLEHLCNSQLVEARINMNAHHAGKTVRIALKWLFRIFRVALGYNICLDIVDLHRGVASSELSSTGTNERTEVTSKNWLLLLTSSNIVDSIRIEMFQLLDQSVTSLTVCMIEIRIQMSSENDDTHRHINLEYFMNKQVNGQSINAIIESSSSLLSLSCDLITYLNQIYLQSKTSSNENSSIGNIGQDTLRFIGSTLNFISSVVGQYLPDVDKLPPVPRSATQFDEFASAFSAYIAEAFHSKQLFSFNAGGLLPACIRLMGDSSRRFEDSWNGTAVQKLHQQCQFLKQIVVVNHSSIDNFIASDAFLEWNRSLFEQHVHHAQSGHAKDCHGIYPSYLLSSGQVMCFQHLDGSSLPEYIYLVYRWCLSIDFWRTNFAFRTKEATNFDIKIEAKTTSDRALNLLKGLSLSYIVSQSNQEIIQSKHFLCSQESRSNSDVMHYNPISSGLISWQIHKIEQLIHFQTLGYFLSQSFNGPLEGWITFFRQLNHYINTSGPGVHHPIRMEAMLIFEIIINSLLQTSIQCNPSIKGMLMNKDSIMNWTFQESNIKEIVWTVVHKTFGLLPLKDGPVPTLSSTLMDHHNTTDWMSFHQNYIILSNDLMQNEKSQKTFGSQLIRNHHDPCRNVSLLHWEYEMVLHMKDNRSLTLWLQVIYHKEQCLTISDDPSRIHEDIHGIVNNAATKLFYLLLLSLPDYEHSWILSHESIDSLIPLENETTIQLYCALVDLLLSNIHLMESFNLSNTTKIMIWKEIHLQLAVLANRLLPNEVGQTNFRHISNRKAIGMSDTASQLNQLNGLVKKLIESGLGMYCPEKVHSIAFLLLVSPTMPIMIRSLVWNELGGKDLRLIHLMENSYLLDKYAKILRFVPDITFQQNILAEIEIKSIKVSTDDALNTICRSNRRVLEYGRTIIRALENLRAIDDRKLCIVQFAMESVVCCILDLVITSLDHQLQNSSILLNDSSKFIDKGEDWITDRICEILENNVHTINNKKEWMYPTMQILLKLYIKN